MKARQVTSIQAGSSSWPRVALLIETSRAYGRGLLVGIAAYCKAHGPWAVEFQEGDIQDNVPKWMKDWQGHGIIARIKTRAVAEMIASKGVPTIDLYCGLPDLKAVFIRSDENKVGRLAAEHLLERGFHNFAFCGYKGADWSDRRRIGFQTALAEAGLACQVFENPHAPQCVSRAEYEEYGTVYEEQLQAWLAGLRKPVGIMTCNDARARQVVLGCRKLGLVVPDNMALIGVDKDEIMCELCEVPLSSVILDTTRIGFEAAAQLDRMMAGQAPPKEPTLIEPIGVVTRRSTDVLSVDDQNLFKALVFIRDHISEPIRIRDVAAHAGLSESVLKRRFRAVLHESVHEKIIRSRLQKARELLIGTDLSATEVAERAGFKHGEYMGAVFKERLGKTPAGIRGEYQATHGRILNQRPM
jgi:LacI family transcriptional regulator